MTSVNKPQIDVIIPTYNGLRWLPAAMDSVLNQTYSNWNLYVIDDGSTDKTSSYVKSLKDKRIKLIRQNNQGVSAARNHGIKISGSPFITFLDSDDLWYPTKLQDQVDIMLSKPEVGLVYGYHYIINDRDIVTGSLRINKRGHLFDELCNGNIIAGSASMAMLRRSVTEKAGFFREDFVNGEDWEYWLRISRLCEIDFVPKLIVAIRQHGDSAQTNTKKMADGLIKVFETIVSEYNLTRSQRIYVASYCLFNAAKDYYAIRQYRLSRQTTARLLKENPRAIFEIENWTVKFGFGPYYKILFGNPLFDMLGKVFGKTYGLFDKLSNLAFRIVRKLVKIVRRIP